MSQNIEEGSTGRQMALVILTLWSLAVLQSPRARQLQIKGWLGCFIVVAVAWISISPLWSEDAAFTIRRVIAFLMFCSGALAIASRFSWREIIAFFVFSSLLILVISVIVQGWIGTLHPWSPDYRFKGVMNANTQGINCALLLISAIACSGTVKKWRHLLFVIAAVAFVFLILTKSRTAVAAGTVAAVICLGIVAPRLRPLAISLCFSAVIVTGVIIICSLVTGQNELASLLSLGKENAGADTQASLSGRIPLWTYLFSFIMQHPFVGYGYSSFWTPDRVMATTTDQGWAIESSHSGYVGTALCLGIPGLILLLVVLGGGILQSLRRVARTKAPGPAFALSIIVYMSLNMVNEELVDKKSLAMFALLIILSRIAFTSNRPAVANGA